MLDKYGIRDESGHILSFDNMDIEEDPEENPFAQDTLDWKCLEEGYFFCSEEDPSLHSIAGFPHFHGTVSLVKDKALLKIQYLGKSQSKNREILFNDEVEAYMYVEDLIWREYKKRA